MLQTNPSSWGILIAAEIVLYLGIETCLAQLKVRTKGCLWGTSMAAAPRAAAPASMAAALWAMVAAVWSACTKTALQAGGNATQITLSLLTNGLPHFFADHCMAAQVPRLGCRCCPPLAAVAACCSSAVLPPLNGPCVCAGGFELSFSMPIVYVGLSGRIQMVAGIPNHLYVSRKDVCGQLASLKEVVAEPLRWACQKQQQPHQSITHQDQTLASI